MDIKFGISGYIECSSPEVKHALTYIEHGYADILDAAATRPAPGIWCAAHAPDVQDEQFLQAIRAFAAVPEIGLVNVHARPIDEYTLCASCGRRLVNSQRPDQRCDHCLTRLSDWQSAPEVQLGGIDTVVKSLLAAHEMLTVAGKRMTVENTYEPPELMRRILDRLPPSVGFTIDVGHSMLYHTGPLDYVGLLADRLCHLHLHDNLGGFSEAHHDLHLAPGLGRCDWGALAMALRRVGFAGTATFECEPRPGWIANWLARPSAT